MSDPTVILEAEASSCEHVDKFLVQSVGQKGQGIAIETWRCTDCAIEWDTEVPWAEPVDESALLRECYEVLGEVEWTGVEGCQTCDGMEPDNWDEVQRRGLIATEHMRRKGHAPDCRLSALRSKLSDVLGEK